MRTALVRRGQVVVLNLRRNRVDTARRYYVPGESHAVERILNSDRPGRGKQFGKIAGAHEVGRHVPRIEDAARPALSVVGSVEKRLVLSYRTGDGGHLGMCFGH